MGVVPSSSSPSPHIPHTHPLLPLIVRPSYSSSSPSSYNNNNNHHSSPTSTLGERDNKATSTTISSSNTNTNTNTNMNTKTIKNTLRLRMRLRMRIRIRIRIRIRMKREKVQSLQIYQLMENVTVRQNVQERGLTHHMVRMDFSVKSTIHRLDLMTYYQHHQMKPYTHILMDGKR